MTAETVTCPFEGAAWPPGNGDPGAAHRHPPGTPPCGSPESILEPCGCPAGAHAEGDPGGFYVTVKDHGKTGWLLGPYATHGEALALVGEGRALAEAVNSRAFWYAYGTARVATGNRPAGLLTPSWDEDSAWIGQHGHTGLLEGCPACDQMMAAVPALRDRYNTDGTRRAAS
jgi:hypothetical protein